MNALMIGKFENTETV